MKFEPSGELAFLIFVFGIISMALCLLYLNHKDMQKKSKQK